MSKYRKIILLFLYVLITTNVFSQLNLVPNPSFEKYDTNCLWSSVDSVAHDWFTPEGTYNKAWGSADYYNANSKNIYFIVPQNFTGYQYAYEGQAYVGVVLIDSFLDCDYRENIETKLTEALKKDIYYNVKLHYVYAEVTKDFYQPYKLGVLITDTLVYRIYDPNTSNCTRFWPILTTPQFEINIDYPIDSVHWKTEEFTFKATGGEQYLTIGSFGNVEKIPYLIYLYLDDISVIPIYPANAGDSKKLCKGDSILIGDNNYTEYEYCWFKKGSADTLSKQGQIWVKPDTTTTYILHQTYNKNYLSSDTIIIDVNYNFCHKENGLIVYPNPGNGQFLFEFKNPIAGNVEIEVFDVIGRKVKDLRFESNDYRANFTVNMVGFGSGVYSYRLSNGENHFSGRLMVVK